MSGLHYLNAAHTRENVRDYLSAIGESFEELKASLARIFHCFLYFLLARRPTCLLVKELKEIR